MMGNKETYIYSERGRSDRPFLTDPGAIEEIRGRIRADVRSLVDEANADGVVVAMSGGIDSTVTAALAVEALGSDRVLGLGLPCHKAEHADVRDARTIAEGFGIEFEELQLRPLLETFRETAAAELDVESAAEDRSIESSIETGNAIARLRMCCAYYAANCRSRLVLGTANRSELLLGYFTKYGDGAVDAHPIGDLYKTEVRALAKRLGIPRRIVYKEPTAGFWADQTDADELGATYETIDPLLRRLVDENESIDEAAAAVGVDRETAASIASLYETTRHKRALPPTPGIAGRSGGLDR